MEQKEFCYDIEEIEVDLIAINRQIGYKNEPLSQQVAEIVNKEIELFPKSGEIKGAYSIYDSFVDSKKNKIVIKDAEFEVGKKIAGLLKNSEQIALFICTAGEYVSTRSKKLMKNGELLEGYVVDVIGSEIVEKAMDKAHSEMIAEFDGLLKVTYRYSPGYCEWNVAEQKKLFSFFQEGLCGITLSESSLMTPIKSISGFIGLGKEVKYKEYSCNLCNLKQCKYQHKKV